MKNEFPDNINYLNGNLLQHLPLMFYKPVETKKINSFIMRVKECNFYQTKRSICYNSQKPISKLILLDEKD
jgi:hypothetical protein